jgi:hypothetical protein
MGIPPKTPPTPGPAAYARARAAERAVTSIVFPPFRESRLAGEMSAWRVPTVRCKISKYLCVGKAQIRRGDG